MSAPLKGAADHPSVTRYNTAGSRRGISSRPAWFCLQICASSRLRGSSRPDMCCGGTRGLGEGILVCRHPGVGGCLPGGAPAIPAEGLQYRPAESWLVPSGACRPFLCSILLLGTLCSPRMTPPGEVPTVI